MRLVELGWDGKWEAGFTPHREAGLLPGRIAVEDKHAYFVVGEGAEWSGKLPGRMLHVAGSRAALPKVGDWVAVRPAVEPGKASIEAVLPRRTQLSRKMAGRQVEDQVLAANVDAAFIVQALDASFNPRRLERFLAMVHEGGVQPVVVLNKSDLGDAVEARAREAAGVAGAVPVLVASARTGEGMDQFAPWLGFGLTAVFLGASGVGKSSLINQLCGREVQATLEVRECDAKGRHATTWREMIPLPKGGLVIDTPGMREFQVWMADDGVQQAFADVEALAVGCHFRDCSHTVEKRCAVLAAIDAGALPRHRLDSYLKLRRDLAFMEEERRKHTYVVRRPGERRRRRTKGDPDSGEWGA